MKTRKTPPKMTALKRISSQFKCDGIQMPMHLEDIDPFERFSNSVLMNIQLSQRSRNKKVALLLLIIDFDKKKGLENSLYAYIKNHDRILGLDYDGKKRCPYCMHSIRVSSDGVRRISEHISQCQPNGGQRIAFPKDKYIFHKNYAMFLTSTHGPW